MNLTPASMCVSVIAGLAAALGTGWQRPRSENGSPRLGRAISDFVPQDAQIVNEGLADAGFHPGTKAHNRL